MSICNCLSKFGLTIINIVFLVIGAAVIILGAFMCYEYSRYGDAGTDHSIGIALLPALVLIIVGVMAITLGAIGCCATFNANKCVTTLYFIILLLLLFGLVTGAIVSGVYHGKIDEGLHKALENSLNNYLDNVVIKAQVDFMQTWFECCGVESSLDWVKTPWYLNHAILSPLELYPESCCKNQECTYLPLVDPNLHGKGCYSLVKNAIQKYLVVIACVTGGFAFLLVLGMVLSCVVLVHKRRYPEVHYVILPSVLPSQPHDVRI